MRFFLGIILLTPFLFSCNRSNNQELTRTLFGGEIVNPVSPFVLLFKGEEVVDTAWLNKENQFIFKLDSIQDGLFHFVHEPEYQYVILERGDSLMLRLNTMDFDESLIFTGQGSEKNNFLVQMFLNNERDEDQIYNWFKEDASSFRTKVDSLFIKKSEKLKQLMEATSQSELGEKILQASIDFPYWAQLELYPYRHRMHAGLERFDSIPEGFYSYRKNLQLEEPLLADYRPYLRFLLMHISHMAYEDDGSTKGYEKSNEFNIRRLELTDSLLKFPETRNNILQYFAYDYLMSNSNPEDTEVFLEKYFAYSTNPKYDKDIDELNHNILALGKGNYLPDISVINTQDAKIPLSALIDKRPTVFYFWSTSQPKHMSQILERIGELNREFPKVHFVGISTTEDRDQWLMGIGKNNLDEASQYRGDNYKQLRRQLVISNFNKTIVVNSQGKIVNGFCNIEKLEDCLRQDAHEIKFTDSQ